MSFFFFLKPKSILSLKMSSFYWVYFFLKWIIFRHVRSFLLSFFLSAEQSVSQFYHFNYCLFNYLQYNTLFSNFILRPLLTGSVNLGCLLDIFVMTRFTEHGHLEDTHHTYAYRKRPLDDYKPPEIGPPWNTSSRFHSTSLYKGGKRKASKNWESIISLVQQTETEREIEENTLWCAKVNPSLKKKSVQTALRDMVE